MNRKIFRSLIAFALLLVLALPVSASLGEGSERVFDYSMLFTDDEIAALQAKLDSLRTTYNMDFLVLTSDESYEGDSSAYADDFYDYNGFGVGFGDDRDGFVFFIDMYNRVPTISTRGLMIRYVTDSRLSVLLDAGYDYLASGSYGDAAMVTLNTLEEYLIDGIPSNQYNIDEYGSVDYYRGEPKSTNWVMIIVIGLLAGIIAALIFYFANKHSYSLKGSQYRYNYNDNHEAVITQSSDTYIRSSVTRTPKAPPPSSGGGSSSSTHISSSGASHGGGSGRKF